MENRLVQRQSQRMTLAPQLRQGLKLLAMSRAELNNAIADELSKNPVLDEVGSRLPIVKAGLPAPAKAEADDGHRQLLENRAEEETLEHHLLAQLPTSDILEADYPLAERLIGELDDDGRFIGSIPDIIMEFGASEQKIKSLLKKIRDFDPAGCGAMTIAECLSAQLDKIVDPSLRLRVAKLLGDLNAVAAGKVSDLEALKALRTLDPRPGRAYRRDIRESEYVQAEVHAIKCEDGWAAKVDARNLPELRISSKYLTMLEDPSIGKETKDYVRERIAAAKTIIDAIAKRQETIENIAQAIFDRQPAFFKEGLKGLEPLTMSEIAKALKLNVSTVSRTVNGKFATTPKGTVELRRFFSPGVVTSSGKIVSRASVIDRIKALVADENRAKPLTDDRLAAMLKADGFSVARRTVAKYRKLAGISDAAERSK